jgi:branched-chain amino acid transport system ATP-binding protein
MLSLRDAVVHYGGVQALKGISLEVEEGAITCLIGANGAGKSTTLRAISGIAPLTSGEIWFQDRRIDGMEPEEIVELGIGHVPEGKKLFLEMNVRDNLMTGAYLRRGKQQIEQDLDRVCKYFPVLGIAINRLASNMSGGEQQMLSIARGLMGAPKLLLLDEPSLGLSPILTREVGAIIKQIAEEGVSILLIEQNASLALRLAKKCYVLETGNITMEGSGRELQDNEHVKAAYLGITAAGPPPGGRGRDENLHEVTPDEKRPDGRRDVVYSVSEQDSLPEERPADHPRLDFRLQGRTKEAASSYKGAAFPTRTGTGPDRGKGRGSIPKRRGRNIGASARIVKKTFTPKQS